MKPALSQEVMEDLQGASFLPAPSKVLPSFTGFTVFVRVAFSK